MADRLVDYDRGAIIMTHPGTGMDVFMYVDEPGKYMTAHLADVPDQIAREAGYDVDRLSKEKLRRSRKAQASAIIDKELADEANTTEECVNVLNGFKLVSIGMGRHNVKDPDGNVLNAHPLPKESADKLFHAMAGVEEKATKAK